MNRLIGIIFIIFLFSSCVQEIPIDEIESETFTSGERSVVTPLIISQNILNLTKNSVQIQWKLNIKGNGQIEYGKSESLGLFSSKTTDYQNDHMQSLINLEEDTQYFYRIVSSDDLGNRVQSQIATFKTNALVDITAPKIANILPDKSLPSGTTKITLSFSTDEKSICKLSTLDNTVFADMTMLESTNSSKHSQEITDLIDGETYKYYILCQDESKNTSSLEVVSFNIPVLNIDGASLYAVHCMSCHNPLNDSTKKGRTAVLIEKAILENSYMKVIPSLTALTKEQVQAIASVLEIIATPEENESTAEVKRKYIIGTRRYIASKLTKIFYEQDKDEETKKIIEDNILFDDQGLFGGNCTVQDLDCNGTNQVKSSGLMLPNTHAIRSSVIYNSCQQVLDRSKSVNSALLLAGLTVSSSGDDASNIESLFEVFYPGMAINNEVSDELRNIYMQSKLNGLSDLDAWKMTMDTMCKSALFEIF